MVEFKETRRQTGIQKKHSTDQKRSKKTTKAFLGQICYNLLKICYKFRTQHIQDSTQSVQNFKTYQRKCKGNSTYSRKHRWKCIPSVLWKAMEYNKHKWTTKRITIRTLTHFITLDQIEKELKLTKNGKSAGQDNINLELYKYVPEEFKLKLVQFLNDI